MPDDYTWRPSTFVAKVSHIAVNGQAVQEPDLDMPCRWVLAVCGQSLDAEGEESSESIRCPECLTWLRSYEHVAGEPIRPGRPHEPDRVQQ